MKTRRPPRFFWIYILERARERHRTKEITMAKLDARTRKILIHRLGESFCPVDRCKERKDEGDLFCLEHLANLPVELQAAIAHGVTVEERDLDEEEPGDPHIKVAEETALAMLSCSHWYAGWTDEAIKEALQEIAAARLPLEDWQVGFVTNVAKRTRSLTIPQRLKAVEIIEAKQDDLA